MVSRSEQTWKQCGEGEGGGGEETEKMLKKMERKCCGSKRYKVNYGCR